MTPQAGANDAGKTAMRSVICSVAVLAVVSIPAMAAESTNMIGTWSVVSKKPATPGEGTPTELASLSIKIVRQDRDSFSGTIVGSKGKSERIVGSFRRDGKMFVYTSDKTAGVGKVQGNEMQICRTDTGCAVLTRTK
jgi:hypothetical protein